MSDPILTLQEAADLCKCSVRKLQRHVASGDFPVVKLGRLTRVFRAELEAFLKRQQTKTT